MARPLRATVPTVHHCYFTGRALMCPNKIRRHFNQRNCSCLRVYVCSIQFSAEQTLFCGRDSITYLSHRIIPMRQPLPTPEMVHFTHRSKAQIVTTRAHCTSKYAPQCFVPHHRPVHVDWCTCLCENSESKALSAREAASSQRVVKYS